MMFVAGAVACLAITGIIEWSSRPAAIEEFGRVGEEFYPEFTDPTAASSLEVYAFDSESVTPLDFRVEQLENGRWVIPSRHGYPADAEDQLSKTAASVIGIRRGAMVTRWPADHAQFGVVNPRQDTLNVGDVEGVGKRIVLRGQDDAVLADYIIGNPVEGETGDYHVRHPDEEEVYIATLDIDLSTKFSDWIETDLLNVEAWDMTEVTVNDYSFDEIQGQVTKRDVSVLKRNTSSDPWTLDGINEESEEVDTDAMRETVDAIADLKIVGVRPKQKGLTPDLALDRESLSSQRDVDRLQQDLLTRGFLLQQGEGGGTDKLRLIAREGELYAATNEGLVYRLHFGRAFTGSQEELEFGLSADDGDEGEDADDEAASEEADDTTTSGKPGRYVFVRVEFDKQYLGEEPVKPVEPQEPAELAAAEDAAEESSDEEGADEEAAGDSTEESTEGEDAAEEDPLEEIRKKYEEDKLKYEADLKEYERKSDEFQEKVQDGEEKAEELNRRFAEWYYVIPGESFDKLRLSRGDLVKAKTAEEDEAAGTEAARDAASKVNQAAADAFLAANKEKEGIQTTESGLQYEVLEEGEGESPSETSRVTVKYKGTLEDGTVFDESGDETIEFGVNGVIAGWTEALQLMKPGAKWRLFIPPELAYGEAGSGPSIGPNMMLIFEVELVSFE